jgi:succinoglycan biosynthesis transport protein ExoP
MASVHPLIVRSGATEPCAPPPLVPGEVDLRTALRKLWRRKGVILGVTVLLTVIAALIILQITNLYTAESMVMINHRETQVVNVEAVVSGLVGDAETIESEIQVIKSRGLAERTVDALRLQEEPEFNVALRPPSAVKTLLDLRSWVLADWGGVVGAEERGGGLRAEEEVERQRTRIVDTFLGKLEVSPVGRSRVISISFTSESPRTAAAVANQLADFYIVSQLEAKFEATQRASAWLSGRLAELREAVNQAERAVEAFRQQSGLIQGKDATLKAQEISELNAQLVTERTKRAETESRLLQVERLLNGADGAQAISKVLQSPLMQSLRVQQAEVERQAAELSQEYGGMHPNMMNIRAEAEDVRQKIAEEVDRIVQGLRNEVSVARAREGTLAAALDRLRQEVGQANTDEVTLRALEREAEASRALLETFLVRSKETGSQESFQQADAAVISRAHVPENPSYPRRHLLLIAAVGGAGFLGLMLALGVEMLDQGFRSAEQIEHQMGVPPLGLVPAIRGLGKLRHRPDMHILEKPASAYAEAIRNLYTGLVLSGGEQPPKTILVASALPREGKTSIALSLARMLASTGYKVVLVDCDLRRPTMHDAFSVHSQPGVVEVLLGKTCLEEVLATDPRSGARLVPAGEAVPNPAELLGLPQMKRFLAWLAEGHDFVILDSPPVLAVSDARVLARMVDRTLYLVRWADTRRERAIAGWRQLVEAGGQVAGVALTLVDVRRHAQYGYSDSGAYYGQLKKYYTG